MKIYKVIPVFVPCPNYIGHGVLFISTEVEPIKAGDMIVNLNKTQTGGSVTLAEKDLSDLEANMFYHSGNRKVIDNSRDHQPGDFFYWSLHQWLDKDKDKGDFSNEPFDYLPGVDDSLKELRNTIRETYSETHSSKELSEIEEMLILITLLGGSDL